MKVAVAPESVPRLGARAALQIPPIFAEVHRWIRQVVAQFPGEVLPGVVQLFERLTALRL